ncbi:MAG: GNAT family N-acetyltransferase [Parvularculaceae bacterium]|nr:GNAT family N-acetyltransferase [Parvularculaceae bacterium]
MRALLWPGDHELEIGAHFDGGPATAAVFVVDLGDGRLGGFIEVGARAYAEGCDTSPVAYVEGWWVDEDLRRKGVGAALMRAGEAWARERGFAEIASDALIENAVSLAAHRALGFQEIERIVCFAKAL